MQTHHFDCFLSGQMIILRLHDQNTPYYFLGVDKDWIECKDKSEKVEFDNIEVRKILMHTLILPSVKVECGRTYFHSVNLGCSKDIKQRRLFHSIPIHLEREKSGISSLKSIAYQRTTVSVLNC
jgi:hypothetical protein